jgi:hypothetical protein
MWFILSDGTDTVETIDIVMFCLINKWVAPTCTLLGNYLLLLRFTSQDWLVWGFKALVSPRAWRALPAPELTPGSNETLFATVLQTSFPFAECFLTGVSLESTPRWNLCIQSLSQSLFQMKPSNTAATRNDSKKQSIRWDFIAGTLITQSAIKILLLTVDGLWML